MKIELVQVEPTVIDYIMCSICGLAILAFAAAMFIIVWDTARSK